MILALDQGTTSSRAILFDVTGAVRGIEQQEFPQHYPQAGWVEHDPEDLWFSQLNVAARVLHAAGVRPQEVRAIGIANQRETVVLWERATGRPVAPAIVWQDRRTTTLCEELRAQGLEPLFRERTGLPLDPYFSAPKVRWLLDHVPGLRARAERGEIAFGTVDTFLLWRLTGGAVHATDVSNAARTLLFDLHRRAWSEELIALMQIPPAMLPAVRPSSTLYGETVSDLFGAPIPIGSLVGDQQAATFGQACHAPGMVKNTYGTGCFLLMNTGARPQRSRHGLLTTVGWQVQDAVTYALEGSVFVAGAAVQWLRDELQVIRTAAEIEALAASVPDSAGVYFVPAFAGLGAPYWDPCARGTVLGLTRGAGRAHLARAVLEAVCFQTGDVLDAMQADYGQPLTALRVDGGMTVNNTLLQMQADLLGIPVTRPAITETTALGAAYLAGLAVGLWQDVEQIGAQWQVDRVFTPQISGDERLSRRDAWHRAVERARNWSCA
ncbi:MAG: glycerol kinase GlpK [Chloroherpetonaceae bacterium]|nr:glycerol kinase GlpK [Chthonomonadaceae bacterium]MDW8207950.1 glycerol kinase GlpK [Chloroherpetonaceae bacterium]